jgi:hypothetical protein
VEVLGSGRGDTLCYVYNCTSPSYRTVDTLPIRGGSTLALYEALSPATSPRTLSECCRALRSPLDVGPNRFLSLPSCFDEALTVLRSARLPHLQISPPPWPSQPHRNPQCASKRAASSPKARQRLPRTSCYGLHHWRISHVRSDGRIRTMYLELQHRRYRHVALHESPVQA